MSNDTDNMNVYVLFNG